MEIRVTASSKLFRGCTDVYTDAPELEEMAELFRGYPRLQGDSFRTELGKGERGNLIIFEAFCIDAAAHPALAVRLENWDAPEIREQPETADLAFRFEPAAADLFASELARIAREQAGLAYLEGIE